MNMWKVISCIENIGGSSVEAWLAKLSRGQLDSVSKELMLLELSGNELRLPHSKSLGNGLFELREKRFGYRIYYTFMPERTIVLLQAGDKKSQKKDIKIARLRLSKL